MTSEEIRQLFLDFFTKRGHKIVPSSSLLPSDPSVLLTTAGMQQFKNYYTNPEAAVSDFGSTNVVSIQKCFRTSDIDEVGDERHLTFFEMLGNFSFGGYWKKEAIEYAWKFITSSKKDGGLEISKERIYVTIHESIPLGRDDESCEIWEKHIGISKDKIKTGGIEDNFWGPTGSEGPCGPTTEIYVDGIEIWNIVFNQYFSKKSREQSFKDGWLIEDLNIKGIDTGMGLERLAMVVQGKGNVFETDLFSEFKTDRVLADHGRAISFLMADGVRPDNKGVGYILRRLLRRLLVKFDLEKLKQVTDWMVMKYGDHYPELKRVNIFEIIEAESKQFGTALELGLKELAKLEKLEGITAFKLYETYGLPFEVMKDKYPDLSRASFEQEFTKHQTISRAGLEKKFAGGLADHEPATIKLHTAHHLLLSALQQVLGKGVKQRGSNINQERLRLDFSFDRKLTDEEKKQVEEIVNERIQENLPVERREMPKAEAEKLGAEMEFGAKYGDTVSVYIIKDKNGETVSAEFCGGPHVEQTGALGQFKILKEEAVASGVRRIKARLA